MSEFYHFNEEPPKRKRGGWGYVIIALVFLVTGGVLARQMGPQNTTPLLQSTTQEPKIAQETPNPNPFGEGENPFSEGQNPFDDDSESPFGGVIPGNEQNGFTAQQPTPTVAPTGEGRSPSLGGASLSMLDSDNPVADIAAQCGPSVVGVINREELFSYRSGLQEQEVGSGSGVVISDEGHILTNYHVIEGANTVMVLLSSGEEVEAKVVGVDKLTDLAVLKVEGLDIPPVPFGNSDELRVGDWAIAIGNPLGKELYGTTTLGIISATNRNLDSESGITHLQTDAAINAGNSGGALFNIKGELIGINSMKASSGGYGTPTVEGLGFAIPINDAQRIAKELIENGKINRPAKPRLGVSIQGLEAEPDVYPAGLQIASITENSPAAKSGLRVYDIITMVDGQDVLKMDSLPAYFDSKKIGDTVTVTVYRMERKRGQTGYTGAYLDIEVVLGEVE